MATENVRILKIDTAPAQTSVQDLRKELKELRNTLLSTEQGTEEYNKVLQQAADIQHTLKEQTEELNASAMDFGQITGNIVKATGGLVAGLQAAKATMNLFGIENEDVIKSLEKMQNLMAITQAIPALDEGVKAFKRLSTVISTATGATSKFGKALISTGLGALVVALGYLIANFEEISKWLDEITGETDFLGGLSDKVMGGLNAGWAAVVQSLKAVGNAIVTYVSTPFKAVMDAINAYTSTNGGFADKLKAAGKAMKDGFVSEWKEVGDDFKQIGVVAANAYQEGYEKNKKKRLDKNKEDGKEEGTIKGNAKAEAEEAAYKKRLRQIDATERAEMLALQKLGLGYEEYVAKKEELEDKFTKKRIEVLQNILDTEVGLTEEEIAALQDELIKLQDSLYKKPEKEETNDNSSEDTTLSKAKVLSEAFKEIQTILNEVSDNPAWGNIMNTISQIAILFDDLNKNHIEKGSKEAMNAYIQVAALGLQAVGQMMNGLAAEQDATTKEGFEQQKKFQIAAATMNMLGGVISAWTSAMNPANAWMTIWGQLAMGAASTAAILATGIIQIQKIQQQTMNSNGSAGATPSTGALASINAPVQYTQDVQGASIEGAIKDTKVYVTETDITNTQNRVSVTEQEARY